MRPFSVAHRAAEVADATDHVLDVLVIGLGATGAGVALDAASRGMTVVAVDMGDLASGTSSKSSKLVHGGLRYLEQYDFAMVREGVVERQTLLRIAPHLVWPMDFVYPVWPDTHRRRLLGLGLSTYDVFAGMRNVRRHERVDAARAIRIAPALADSGLAYAYVYGDSATDDARLVLAVIQASRSFGALTLPYAKVVGLSRDEDGNVVGAQLHDFVLDTHYEIRARHVVNATGVWVDDVLSMVEPTRVPAVQPSKGVHIVVNRDRLPLDHASVLLPSKQGDARSMFAIAWGPQTILGTTDTAYEGPLDELSLTEDDLDYVLAAGNAVFDRALTADDVVGAWAGVRPLLRDGEGAESGDVLSDMSRRHTLLDGPGRLVTITGGKLTTYRRMAKDVVDLLIDRDDRRARCRTDEISLGSSQPFAQLLHTTEEAGAPLGIGAGTARVLARHHGDAASDVLSLVAADPVLSEQISPLDVHIFAELVYAARFEGAATLDDVFSRRTRLSLRIRDAAMPAAHQAALLLAWETGRDEAWAAAQVSAYADAVRTERGVLGLPATSPAVPSAD